jgi:uncharacterized protein (DUF1778 family)
MEYTTTEAQRKATRKYNSKAYDLLSVRVPAGERDIFKQAAEAKGMSLAQFVRTACLHEAGYTETE